MDGPRLEIDSPGLRASLRLGEIAPIESICPSGSGWGWTRKRAGVPIEGTVEVPGRRWQVSAHGVDDESAGYHQRHTSWRWSAGVGRAEDGRALAWNLVEGVNDPPSNSERAIWVDGEPDEPPRSASAAWTGIEFADGPPPRLRHRVGPRPRRELPPRPLPLPPPLRQLLRLPRRPARSPRASASWRSTTPSGEPREDPEASGAPGWGSRSGSRRPRRCAGCRGRGCRRRP